MLRPVLLPGSYRAGDVGCCSGTSVGRHGGDGCSSPSHPPYIWTRRRERCLRWGLIAQETEGASAEEPSSARRSHQISSPPPPPPPPPVPKREADAISQDQERPNPGPFDSMLKCAPARIQGFASNGIQVVFYVERHKDLLPVNAEGLDDRGHSGPEPKASCRSSPTASSAKERPTRGGRLGSHVLRLWRTSEESQRSLGLRLATSSSIRRTRRARPHRHSRRQRTRITETGEDA